MLENSQSRGGVVLACLLVLGFFACGEQADRSSDDGKATGSYRETTEGSHAGWEAFRSTADKELAAIEGHLEAVRTGIAELERAEVDRWTDRVKRAREEMKKEVAEAPEKRGQYREELRREVEEIKREVAVLLTRHGVSESASAPDES